MASSAKGWMTLNVIKALLNALVELSRSKLAKIVMQALNNKFKKASAAGFEPARVTPMDFKSISLDHSDKPTYNTVLPWN